MLVILSGHILDVKCPLHSIFGLLLFGACAKTTSGTAGTLEIRDCWNPKADAHPCLLWVMTSPWLTPPTMDVLNSHFSNGSTIRQLPDVPQRGRPRPDGRSLEMVAT